MITVSDSQNLYKPPNADLVDRKSGVLKNEKKILKDFCNLFEGENKYMEKRNRLANGLLLFSALSIVALFIIAYQPIELTPIHLVAAVFAGLSLGLGIWFFSFISTWPVVRSYIDKEKIRKRYEELNRE